MGADGVFQTSSCVPESYDQPLSPQQRHASCKQLWLIASLMGSGFGTEVIGGYATVLQWSGHPVELTLLSISGARDIDYSIQSVPFLEELEEPEAPWLVGGKALPYTPGPVTDDYKTYYPERTRTQTSKSPPTGEVDLLACGDSVEQGHSPMASIQDLLSAEAQPPLASAQLKTTDISSSDGTKSLHFTIEFILDTICPHCYIGIRNLNTAIDLYKKQQPHATFEVTCSPIILNPRAGRAVDIKEDYYTIRGFAPSTIEEWTRQGAAIGINFNWQNGRTGSSRDSHKLLRLALESAPTTYRSSSFTRAFGHNNAAAVSSQETTMVQKAPGARGPATQMRLLESIFREYFENGHDLSDRAWLQSLAASLTDLSTPEVQACLESDEWDAAIDRLSDRNRQEFNAVPVFILQGRFVAGGWQKPELFLEIFERIRTEGPAAPGGMLSVPGGGWWLPGGVFRTAGSAPGNVHAAA
ncbi:hypothetical protein JX265_000929 [Neoarthrinium moseri]|uniref:DSBA-like thioredoxin domain-containing protein n=1 Tax=Neoarthrinium moseri TaxID=1658444 RepID=A0A9Q0AVZ2_9PEZI|nr:hypothetical protein JX265_000929 [Neoarthrinium moseri]